MYSPHYCHEKLAKGTSTATDDDDHSSVDVASEAYTEETTEKTNTCDHNRHGKSILNSRNSQEISRVDVYPGRS
jgi:hypothetical protein